MSDCKECETGVEIDDVATFHSDELLPTHSYYELLWAYLRGEVDVLPESTTVPDRDGRELSVGNLVIWQRTQDEFLLGVVRDIGLRVGTLNGISYPSGLSLYYVEVQQGMQLYRRCFLPDTKRVIITEASAFPELAAEVMYLLKMNSAWQEAYSLPILDAADRNEWSNMRNSTRLNRLFCSR